MSLVTGRPSSKPLGITAEVIDNNLPRLRCLTRLIELVTLASPAAMNMLIVT